MPGQKASHKGSHSVEMHSYELSRIYKSNIDREKISNCSWLGRMLSKKVICSSKRLNVKYSRAKKD